MKRGWNGLSKKKWLISFALSLAVIYILYFFLFGVRSCEDFSCFNSRLKECRPTKFIGGEKMIYQYEILRKSGDFCLVDVKLIQGDLDRENSDALEGFSMRCGVPIGVSMRPEADIDQCHGILKEKLQNQIIQKLHNYIAQNIGRINLDILKAPKSLKKSEKNSTRT